MIRWTNTKGGVQFLFIYFSLYLVFKIVQNWHSTLGRVGAVLQSIFFSLTTATFSFQDKSSGHQNEMLILIGKLYLSYVLKYFPYFYRLCCLDDMLLVSYKNNRVIFLYLRMGHKQDRQYPMFTFILSLGKVVILRRMMRYMMQ